MYLRRLTCIISFFVLLISNQAHASHAVGADLTYVCLGGNTYRFTLTLYRDCAGIGAPGSASVNITSATCGISTSANLNLVSSQEISPICNAQINQSTCNGGGLPGTQQYVYSGNFTLPQQCSDWRISYSLCCRNNAITNSSGASGYSLYVEAFLNNLTVACNNSPDFTTPPVPYICVGQTFNYNHGALDVDGDSLVYTLVAPRDNATGTVPYSGGFSATYPISTMPANNFVFNNLTGQMTFTPGAQQIAILAVRVDEYRNGVLIGSVLRDMQVIVLNCTNSPPVLSQPTGVSGGNLNNGTFSTCVGNQLSFSFTATDPDPANSVLLTSNLATGIPGATLTVSGGNPLTATFTWNPTVADIGSHSFAINVEDNACPITGFQVAGYDIVVTGVEASTADNFICTGFSETIPLAATIYGGSGSGTLQWSTSPLGAAVFSAPNSANTNITTTQPTQVILSYTEGVCTSYDTLDISSIATLTLIPQSAGLCIGQSLNAVANYTSINQVPDPCNVSSASCAVAATTHTVGNGNNFTNTANASVTPFQGRYHDGHMQILVRRTELLAAGVQPGLISSLAFRVAAKNSTAPYTDLTVRIGCVSQNTLTIANFVSGLTTVYTGNITTATGWNIINFTSNYNWDGISNLILEICYDNTSASLSDPVYYTPTAYTSVLYAYLDNNSGCLLTATQYSSQRPNMRFNYCPLNTNISYTWSPNTNISAVNIPNPTVSPTVITNYIVSATDGVCPQRDTLVVNVTNCSPVVITTTPIDVSCFNGTNGQISSSASGGNPPYTYMWGTGDTTVNISGIPAGTYSVTVTDAGGATAEATAVVNEPPLLVVAGLAQDASCGGYTDGQIDVTVTGGTPSYTYAWSNGAVTQDVALLPVGNYTVIVTDSLLCTDTADFVINEPPPVVLSSTHVNMLCFGAATGSIDLTASGGTGPYTFLWSNTLATEDITGLPAGTYTVTVNDNNSCTATLTESVTQGTAITSSPIITDALCFGSSDGIITVTPAGGGGSYTYNWSSGSGTQTATGLALGNYTVTITDNNSCTASFTYSVGQPQALAATAVIDSANCFGSNDGSILQTVTGGTFPYTFNWSNGNGNEDIVNLGAGYYTVTVSDNHSCTAIYNYTVSQPAQLTLTPTIDSVNCFGGNDGSVMIVSGGGIPAYTHLWSNGTTTEDLLNVIAGPYTITITDANSCTFSNTYTVQQPTLLQVGLTHTDLTCAGDASGTITATPSGGSPVYSFAWNNGAVTQNLTGLSGGTYTITVSDSKGCTVSGSNTVFEPSTIVLTSQLQNVSCFGGNNGFVQQTVTGGVLPYAFSWSNAAVTEDINNLNIGTYNVVVTDSFGCSLNRSYTITQPPLLNITGTVQNVSCFGLSNGAINTTTTGGTAPNTYLWNTGATTPSLNNIIAGAYFVTVTDSLGCTDTLSFTVTQPALLQVSLAHTDLTCAGDASGTIDATPSGGTTPYTYLWSNSAATQDIANLPGGTYTITVIDFQNCSVAGSNTVFEPDTIVVTSQLQNVSCFGGSNGFVQQTTTGGVVPFTFAWSNAANTEDISNLTIGNYNVLITDSFGCSLNRSYAITQPPLLNITGTVQNVSCFGFSNGAINTTTTGGIAPYTYLWNTGATTPSLNNIIAGAYFVTVTDSLGCTDTLSFTVTQPALLQITQVLTNVSCFGFSNGAYDITLTGGTTPYTYLWNNSINTQDLAAIDTGYYAVTVTDNQNCVITDSAFITQPDTLVTTIVKVDILCNGASTGSVSATVSGGVVPYNYLWSTADTAAFITALPAGNYFLTVTDFNNCTGTTTVALTEPSPVVASYIVTDVACQGESTGAINLTVTGGNPGYSYSWSNGAVVEDISLIPTGSYSVTFTDANSCIDSIINIAVNEPVPFVLTLDSLQNVACFGGANGFIEISLNGATPPYNLVWSNTANTDDISGLSAAVYSVVITDSLACVYTDTFTITEPPLLTASHTHTDNLCFGDAMGTIDMLVNGGVTPYTYLWNTNDTVEDPSALPAGNYNVTVTDFNSCTVTDGPIQITEPAAMGLTYTTTPQTCPDSATGTVNINVSGGISPYNYSWSTGAVSQNLNSLFANIYSVIITDANNCTITETITVTAIPALSLLPEVVNVTCPGMQDGYIVPNVAGGTLPYFYNWSNGISAAYIDNLAEGIYLLSVTDFNNCKIDTSFEIENDTALKIEAGPDVIIKLGETHFIDLFTTASAEATYLWNPINTLSCYDCTFTEAYPVHTTKYYVVANDTNGCVTADSLLITVVPDYTIFIPNAFTPNGDGTNDDLQVFTNGKIIEGFEIQVFDRIGQKVFESNDIYFKWDGKFNSVLLNPQVLVYQATFKFVDGHVPQLYKGSITLLR